LGVDTIDRLSMVVLERKFSGGCSRSLILATVLTLGAACSEIDGELSDGAIADRLREGDTTICVSERVQRLALGSISEWAFEQIELISANIPFETVSASGVDREIDEITCNANITLDDDTFSIAWKVRPALDADGVVVGTPNVREVREALENEVVALQGEYSASNPSPCEGSYGYSPNQTNSDDAFLVQIGPEEVSMSFSETHGFVYRRLETDDWSVSFSNWQGIYELRCSDKTAIITFPSDSEWDTPLRYALQKAPDDARGTALQEGT